MNEQVKEKWLNALRSGDYQQTKFNLRRKDRFCCLGVLCDLYGKEHNLEWELVDVGVYRFQNRDLYLSSSVIEWSGLVSENPIVCNGETSLGYLNDNGSTFNEIADLIQEHL